MCVAVVVESRKGPTPWELMQMDDDNPHGGGIAWAVGNIIRYRKGLTWKQIRDVLPTLPRPVLLHFRWATHGGKARYLSHPFPLGERAITSRKLNSGAQAVLIHNGVWTDYKKFAPNDLDLDKWSDTAVAAWAAGVMGEEILDHVDWATAVGRAAGNGRMDVTTRGRWYSHNGDQYSNLSWQYPSRMYSRLYQTTRGVYASNYNEPVITAYPREPRWDAQGRLTRGPGVTANGLEDLGESVLPSVELLPDISPTQSIDSWFEEFATAQQALEEEEYRREVRRWNALLREGE